MDVIYFDTESSDLAASFGRILCASFAIGTKGSVFTLRGDDPEYRLKRKTDDSKLVVAIREVIEQADLLVGWNSIRHDIPLLDARLTGPLCMDRPVRIGEKYGTWHWDPMYHVPKIGGRSLKRASEYYKVDDEKTPLDGQVWQDAAALEDGAMDKIVEHCEADVLVLREVANCLAPFCKKFKFELSEVWGHIAEIPSRR